MDSCADVGVLLGGGLEPVVDNGQQRRSAQEVQGAQLIGEGHVVGDHGRREIDSKIGLVEGRAARAATVVGILLPYDGDVRAPARLRVDRGVRGVGGVRGRSAPLLMLQLPEAPLLGLPNSLLDNLLGIRILLINPAGFADFAGLADENLAQAVAVEPVGAEGAHEQGGDAQNEFGRLPLARAPVKWTPVQGFTQQFHCAAQNAGAGPLQQSQVVLLRSASFLIFILEYFLEAIY